MDNRRVFAFLDEQLDAGLNAVLVTVIAVDGSSMRGPGTHMGVSEDGRFAGSLSGGCIENAVVAEALDALANGKPRIVRFGSGSRYIDIRLPCGGGLDIHFMPLLGSALVKACLQAVKARLPFSVRLPLGPGEAEILDRWHPLEWSKEAGTATIGHCPEPRLLVIGHGAAVTSLAGLARKMDLTIEALSPDESLLASLASDTIATHWLANPGDISAVKSDRWTAIVFLFHDHDWETALMAQALREPHFYIGAMGGRKAHSWRSEALAKVGCSAEQIATIHAPIGLFHSARDPDTLALSALAQIIEAYHRQNFTKAGG